MFTVRSISGSYIPYERGSVRIKRADEIVSAITPIGQKEEVVVKPELGVSNVEPRTYGNRKQEAPVEKKKALLAKDIMKSPVFTVDPDLNVNAAWSEILKRRFRHLLVIDKAKHLIGILSDRDLLRHFANGTNISKPETEIGLIMHKQILSAAPTTEIREIAKVMVEEKIGCVPILDESRKLMGIITRSDILRVILNKTPVELWV